jgi:hypothetical protein
MCGIPENSTAIWFQKRHDALKKTGVATVDGRLRARWKLDAGSHQTFQIPLEVSPHVAFDSLLL